MRSTTLPSSCATGTSMRPRRRLGPHVPRKRRSATRARHGSTLSHGRTLTTYRDWRGRSREIVILGGAAGSTLVLDRDAGTRLDRRLLAHLAADEPTENALLVSRSFVRRAERTRCSCRRLSAADLRVVPFSDQDKPAPREAQSADRPALYDERGRCYRLASVFGSVSKSELRWCRDSSGVEGGESQLLSVRETVAGLERYEPVLTLTRQALVDAQEGTEGAVSVATIRTELNRLLQSPIVLNRALRLAAVAAIEQHGLSMSEIAMRCGRVKHDAAGNASGETSWLARRLGLLPEGGRRAPTPWIHSNVLALIARDGLGLSPREVEAS